MEHLYYTLWETYSTPILSASESSTTATEGSADERDEGEYCCGVCDVKCGTDNKLRIECATWFHNSCVHIDDKKIPDVFLCCECAT